MTWQSAERLRRPDTFLAELLRKYIRGQLVERTEAVRFMLRAAVLAVDVEGGRFENEGGAGEYDAVVDGRSAVLRATVGPSDPPNSVKARVITGGLDRFTPDGDVMTFWPLLPADHISVPVKPGEHVYVTYEDESKQHGVWLCRVPGHLGANVAVGALSYSGGDRTTAMSAFEDGEAAEITDSDEAASVPSVNANSSFGGAA